MDLGLVDIEKILSCQKVFILSWSREVSSNALDSWSCETKVGKKIAATCTYGISNAISKDIWPLCEPNIETATRRCVTRSSYKSGLSTTAMYRSKEMHPKN